MRAFAMISGTILGLMGGHPVIIPNLCRGDTPAAQPPPSLVGAWRLVSFVRTDSAGVVRPFWDDRPSGFIVYTAEGFMGAQLYDSRRQRLGVPVPRALDRPANTSQSENGTNAADTAIAATSHRPPRSSRRQRNMPNAATRAMAAVIK